MMRSETRIVTPTMAQSFLAMNRNNRKVRKSHVNHLASQMKSGHFILTHQGIAFSSDGKLIDGQHRLKAIVQSNVSVPMMISYDVPEEAFPVVDGGVKRNVADRLRLPKSHAEVVNFMTRLLSANGYSDNEQLKSVLEVFEPVLDAVAVKHIKLYSAAPLRSAAAVRALEDDNFEYATTLLENLAHGRFNEVPPVALSFAGQHQRGLIHMTDTSDLFARGMILFAKENRNTIRVQVKNPSYTVDQTRAYMKKKYPQLHWIPEPKKEAKQEDQIVVE